MDDSEEPAKTYRQAEKDRFGHFEDVDDIWIDILDYASGDRFYAKDDEYTAYQNPKVKAKPTAPPKVKKTIQLHMGPDEYSMSMPFSDASQITAHAPYDLGPGWSSVTILDDEGTADFFAKTDELNDFLGIGGSPTPVKGTESSSEEDTSTVGSGSLDASDYPAGDYPVTVKGFLKLPASTTPDGIYNTSVEIFPGETITAHVEDDLTEDYGRCRIVFFSQTYYVPLQMLVPKPEGSGSDELSVTEVDDEDFIPEDKVGNLETYKPSTKDQGVSSKTQGVKLPFDALALKVYFEYEEWDMMEQQLSVSAEVFKTLTPQQVAELAAQYAMKVEAVQSIIDRI